MRNRMKLISVLLLVTAMLLTSCGRQEAKKEKQTSRQEAWSSGQGMAEGTAIKAADFALADQDGKQVALADFAGKIVVLEWINPDCPYVQRHYQAKTMADLSKKYSGQDVVWLAVNSTHYMNQQTNKDWASKYGLQYPILDDHDGTVGKLYEAKTTPHMFIIDKIGQLVYHGAIDDDPQGTQDQAVNYVDQALTELLAGKPVSVPESKPYGCSVKYAK